MLKSNAIVISTKNHKPEKFDVICNFVRFTVRNFEYEKVYNQIKETRDTLENEHEGINALTCDESKIREFITDAVKAQEFIDLRNELNSIIKERDSFGVTLDQYNSLSATDKVFITLQAHTALTAIKLDKDIVKDIDLEKPIAKYFASGSLKGIKDIFKSIFTNVVGQEGELFYSVKLKKSDFSDEDLRNCLAYFRGTAKRGKVKKDGGEIYTDYTWDKKDGKVNAQTMALTNLFAVVLDCSKDYEIIKPEETVVEKPEETTK